MSNQWTIQKLYLSDGEGYTRGNALSFDEEGRGFLDPSAGMFSLAPHLGSSIQVFRDGVELEGMSIIVKDERQLRKLFGKKAESTAEMIPVRTIYLGGVSSLAGGEGITRLDGRALYTSLYLLLCNWGVERSWWMKPDFGNVLEDTVTTKQRFSEIEVCNQPNKGLVEVRVKPGRYSLNADNLEVRINDSWVTLYNNI